jgi:hypothetical protein
LGLARATQKRICRKLFPSSQVTHVSVSISFVIILVLAVAGYQTFTGYTQGEVQCTVYLTV